MYLWETPLDPDEIDILEPEYPLFLLEDDEIGETFRGQSGGASCNRHKARGIVFDLPQKEQLAAFLEGEFHEKWCGSINESGREQLDRSLFQLRIPLRTAVTGIHEEGWMAVEIIDENVLHPIYEGRKRGYLIWNNCE